MKLFFGGVGTSEEKKEWTVLSKNDCMNKVKDGGEGMRKKMIKKKRKEQNDYIGKVLITALPRGKRN